MTIERITEILELIPVGWTAAEVTAAAAETVVISSVPGILAAVIPENQRGDPLYAADDLYPAVDTYPSIGGITVIAKDGSRYLWSSIDYTAPLHLNAGGIAFSTLSLQFDEAGSCRVMYRGKV